MKVSSMMKVAMIASFLVPQLGGGRWAAAASTAPFLGRGATASAILPEKDVVDFAATGGTFLRISFALHPLRDIDPPYAINEGNMALLDHDIDLCEKYHVRVIVDPHRFPGVVTSPFTTHAGDPIWSDAHDQDLAVDLWSVIARREAHRGDVIAGYDLLNEPSLPYMGRKGTLADWNAFAARMSAAIRAVDPRHTIIIESPVLVRGDREGIVVNRSESFASYMAPPSDPNTVYSLHMYEPNEVTFQGLNARFSGASDYPANIGGERWDSWQMDRFFAPVAAYQKRYGVQIFLGEFSATRWSGDAGNRYIKDVIEYCEAHHWSWAYTQWRSSDSWDPEKSNTSKDDHQRYPDTPRLELLKQYWKLGDQLN
ncbi:MAG TPA: cellulase family glycosylhydrolase [Acidobacteriaceae bacterium]|jgi:aryl-phospho-beta-D-glucosidase BglC (GH1 family)|nr:cellulase family glycosylhydrolase [Acidobacteriaceae bacterium]